MALCTSSICCVQKSSCIYQSSNCILVVVSCSACRQQRQEMKNVHEKEGAAKGEKFSYSSRAL